MCGKHVFIDKKEAKASVNRKGTKRTPAKRAYYCSECRGWHVSSRQDFREKAATDLIGQLGSLVHVIRKGGDVDSALSCVQKEINIFKSKFKFFKNGPD